VKEEKKDLTKITREERRAISREVKKVSRATKADKARADKAAAKAAKTAAKATKSAGNVEIKKPRLKLKLTLKVTKPAYIAGGIFLVLLFLYFIIQYLPPNIINLNFGYSPVFNMTDAQLRSAMASSFSSTNKIAIYPSSRLVEIKEGETSGVGIGIKNLMPESKNFSYVISVTQYSNCSLVTRELISSWFVSGKSNNNVPIDSGNFSAQKVLIKMPVNAPLCDMNFNVDVQNLGIAYAADSFEIRILPQALPF
jgi:hypothetical protein